MSSINIDPHMVLLACNQFFIARDRKIAEEREKEILALMSKKRLFSDYMSRSEAIISIKNWYNSAENVLKNEYNEITKLVSLVKLAIRENVFITLSADHAHILSKYF